MRKLRPNAEWVSDRLAQEPVAAQPLKGGGIDCSNGVKRVATGQREIGETQHGKVARIGCPAIRLFATTNQVEPHLVHGVGVAERHARNAAAHQQIDDHGPPKQLARANVLGEIRQLSKHGNDFVDLRVGQSRHDVLNDVVAKSLGDRLADDLLVVGGCDRDQAHVRITRRVHEVTKLLEHAFRNGVGTVDNEYALWSTQFGEQHLERAPEERLELKRGTRKVPQIDAKCLRHTPIGDVREGGRSEY
jgi:hypothetical protein